MFILLLMCGQSYKKRWNNCHSAITTSAQRFQLRNFSSAVMALITLHGFHAATTLSGISFTTTEPAPITTFEPMQTPGNTCTPAPIHTLSPTVMG